MPNPRFLHRLAVGFSVAGGTLLAISTASAFFCYVPEKPEGPVALRERPDPQAKIVAMMPPGGMVREVKGNSRHKEWVQVLWIADQAQQKKVTGRGWVVHSQIHGGECED
ncbi:MAG: hypothetical protein O9322_02870 [Beijerinckiaceae bacterium]|nr:hypothetical protein [Beijerinckiaceae bacterium]MCZ8301507.1 hypothetical protein [Beijerinckiaceae bacterium]